jgi:hypothetical protein
MPFPPALVADAIQSFIVPMPAEHVVDMLILAGGVAGASQSCLVDARAAAAGVPRLAALAHGYLRSLDALPMLSLALHPGGACVGPSFAPRRLALLRFAPPYLAASRGGRELRYPIVGGLMARAPGGHLAVGAAPEGARARVWIDVVAFRPRLGLGPLYVLTQVQVHRLVTTAYLRRAVGQAGW